MTEQRSGQTSGCLVAFLARAAATSFQITPEVLNDPAAFQKFQQVQGELSSALSRLMAVSENYPQLKA
ncbi:LemA family protein, partial [Mycobacterium tuberculosis]|nr:LemA family protein [Mycobacterium tuberculosis]